MQALVNLLGAALQFVVIILAARTYGAAGLGSYALMLAWVSPFFLLGSLSFKQRYFAGQLPDAAVEAVTQSRSVILYAAVGVGVLAWLASAAGVPSDTPWILLVAVILLKLLEMHLDELMVWREVHLSSAKSLLWPLLAALLLLGGVYWGSHVMLAFSGLVIIVSRWHRVGIGLPSSWNELVHLFGQGLIFSRLALAQNVSVLVQRQTVLILAGPVAVGVFTILAHCVVIASIVYQSLYFQVAKRQRALAVWLPCLSFIILIVPWCLGFDELMWLVFAIEIPRAAALPVALACLLVCLDFYCVMQLWGRGQSPVWTATLMPLAGFVVALMVWGAQSIPLLAWCLMGLFTVRLMINSLFLWRR